jgi:hypothetical protein
MRALVLAMMGLGGLSLHDCKKTEATEDASSGPATTATTAATDGPITNEKSVTRYPTEHKLDEDGTVPKDVVAHQSPPNGQMVAVIPANTTVKKIASVPGGTLVVFTDTTGARMMGWLDEQAFTVAPVAPTTTLRFIPTVRDAGVQPIVVDAGGGGGTPVPPPVLDAGGGGAKAVTPVKPAVNGKCDAGWIIFPTGSTTCRKTCSADAECGAGLKCAQKGSQKLCGL